MANQSIYNGFERLWQHVKLETQNKLDAAKDYTDGQLTAELAPVKQSINTLTTDVGNNASAITNLAGDGRTTETVKGNADEISSIKENYATKVQAQGYVTDAITGLNNGALKTLTEGVQANATAIANLAGEGNTSTVKANADAIAQLKADLGNVANVMNFRGVSVKGEGTVPGHDITDPKAGDVIIYGDAEYVYDESGAWVKFGDASDNAAAISELQGNVTALTTRLDTGDIHQAITDNATAAENAQKDATDALAAIAIINGETTGIAAALSEAKSYADGKASAAESAAKSYTDEKLAAVNQTTGDLSTNLGNHIANESNPHKVTAEQVGLGNVENKSVATIKTELTGAVASGNTGFVTGDAVHTAVSAVDQKVTDLGTTVSNNAQSAADATKKVADDLAAYVESNDAAVAAALKAGTDAQAYAEGVAGDLSDLDERVTAAETDLANNVAKVKAIAGTDKFELTVGEDVIIFDCGGAQ